MREFIAVLCSDCFDDRGLQIEAERIGRSAAYACPNCGSPSGAKLRQEDLEPLLVEFFWNGSFFRAEFGGAHRLVSNPYRYGERDVEFPKWLEHDARLLEERLRVGLFHYGPPLWRLGEIEQLTALRSLRRREAAAFSIVDSYPAQILDSSRLFYRARMNLSDAQEADFAQYDAPPMSRRFWLRPVKYGRIDSKGLPVLYASESLEICVHECRVTIPDEIFVATLRAKSDVRLLDLTSSSSFEPTTPFDDMDTAIKYLFSAGPRSYKLTRAIAVAARERGFDGLYYPSYFSLLKPSPVPNVAIFGYPIRTGKIEVLCINRAQLKAANYEVRLGPIFS